LLEAALAIGARWAESFCDELRRDGRAVAGGWPGTSAEARARVTLYLGLELARRHMPLLTSDEVGWAARITYQKAKQDWLATPPSRAQSKRPRRRAAAS
jgi:hypothetical protein